MSWLKNFNLIFRSLWRGKAVTALNIIGLTVGIGFGLLIFIFYINQNSVDQYIPKVDKIYALKNNDITHFSFKEINFIKDEVPEIDKVTYCSVDWSPQIFLKKGEQAFKVKNIMTADSCFFRVFPFEAVYGNPQNALNESNKLVITRSFSEKIFGQQNPVGKTLIYNATYLQGEPLEVTAVIEDFPQNSSWNFEAVLSFQTNYKIGWYVRNMNSWGSRNYKAFMRINDNASEKQVMAKLQNLPVDKLPENLRDRFDVSLFPFSDVYFDLHQLRFLKHGNRLTISIVGIIGILILLLACINYVNMVTAQREKRYKNLGVVRIMGGSRYRIVQMITAESLVQVIVSVVLGILLIVAVLPLFNSLTSLSFSIAEVLSIKHLLLLAGVVLLMLLITGLIPGVILSNNISSFLIKQQNRKLGSNRTRNSLLVFQFSVTIALLVSILIVNKQTQHVQNQDLGFKKEGIVFANTNGAVYKQIKALKGELKRIPGVVDFTFSENVLVNNGQNWGRKMVNNGERKDIGFSKLSVSPNFFKFFDIDIVEGDGFNENSRKKQDFIINQSAKKQFDISNLDNARLECNNPGNGRFVGVIEDYNFESLHVPIRAAGFMCSGECDEVLYLKIAKGSMTNFNETIKEVEAIWNKISPEFPFEYQFLNKEWEAYYKSDQQFRKIILYMTLVSLLLSCLGLVGLTFFVMEQKVKEIGIRKVNGAKITEILTMLNKDFVKWVLIAFVIACPLAWFAMNRWLQNFAYKTTISWWIFAIAGVAAMVVALLTVSWQSWRAATRNPVEALRYE
ncbi:ABC transporter permease [Prolixibacteraceae bacterium JC049]|nr:ABC transporter permease [Prolixibacteraceae bacterium JC049]